MSIKHTSKLAIPAMIALVGLSACTHQQSHVSDPYEAYLESRVDLLPDNPKIEIATHEAHHFVPATPNFHSGTAMEAALRPVAQHWHGTGMGAMHVTVTANNHAHARDVSHLINAAFASHGIPASQVQITQLTGISEGATISWRSGTAHVPNCGDTPWEGIGKPSGCSIDVQIARMVANPKDLTGRVGTDPITGEYAATGIRRHVAGEPAPDYGMLDDISTTD
ncbi:MAG: hypothetical protein Alpg2KO_26730 [Alphaproteobacteria bacterium]